MTYTRGDRVVFMDTNDVSEEFRGLAGVVTEADSTHVWVDCDAKSNPSGSIGWKINALSVSLEEKEPTDDEVAALFGLRENPPGEDSTVVELLEHIDNALRNGSKMTRANLAFEFLLKSLDLTRLDLPSYVRDMQQLEEEDR